MFDAKSKSTEGDASKELHFLRTESLASVVQREIERMILTGELSAGAPINENLLSSKLSISRGPIREACRKLEQAGLLQFHVNRGMFVRELNVEDVLHLYEIRAALAELAGRLLPARISEQTFQYLLQLVEEMDEAIKTRGVDGYYPLNLAFHETLLTSTGNPRLAAIFSGTDKELHIFRRHSLVSIEGLQESNEEHRAIVEALRTRKPERVGRAMKRHILGGRRRLLKSVRERGTGASVEAPSEQRTRRMRKDKTGKRN